MSKDMPSSEDEKSNHFLERSPRIRVTIRGINPCSAGYRNAINKYNKLTRCQKVLTIFLTTIAAAATLPLFGTGGLAAFRFMVERYTFTKIDEPCGTAKKTDEQRERIDSSPEPEPCQPMPGVESEQEMGPSVPPEEGNKNSDTTVLGAAVQLATGLFMESDDPEHIKWKVNKYEALIIGLKGLIQNVDCSLENKDLFQSLSDSWGLIDQNINLSVVFSRILNYEKEPDQAKRFSQENLAQVRGIYNNFLTNIRELIQHHISDKALDQLCYIVFTGISLETESMDTLKFFETEGRKVSQNQSERDEGMQSFSQRILDLHNLISEAPDTSKTPLVNKWCNSFRGTFNWDFNPYQQGNPIHVIYEFQIGGKPVKSIGMGSPTIEDARRRASLSPEFLGFMRHCKTIGKKHLFILNQNTIPKTVGDETNRSNLILEAQNRPELKGALYCVALSKNSDFYYQKFGFKDMSDASKFKQEFFDQLLTKKREISGCYIPESIKNQEGFKDTIEVMMDGIHKTLFDDKQTLNVDERKIFIEIFYDTLTKYLIHSLDVDSFNISCKDAIDRGAGSNAQLYAHSAILAHPEGKLDSAAMQKITILMMVRALFVRKRPPIKERVERMAETVEFMLRKSPDISDLHQKFIGDIQFLPQTIDIN
jgi:hypothetical protein